MAAFQPVIDRFKARFEQLRHESKAATAAMADVARECPELFDRLNDLAESATFTVRSYGRGAFYVWAHVPGVELKADPYPASRYPKALLCVDIAKSLNS
jgi:hypothetical protein